MTASDGAGPDQEAPAWQQPDARMDAYYYGFERTGVPEVDWILSAVAIAGKSAHGTEVWSEPTWDSQTSLAEDIQAAANAAAGSIRERSPRQHCDRCHRPLPHTDAERAACPPADGVEVREEWGVRWEADHHGVMRSSDSWFDTEAQRKSFCTYFHPEIDPRGGRVLAFATRTATYTSTRWEPQP